MGKSRKAELNVEFESVKEISSMYGDGDSALSTPLSDDSEVIVKARLARVEMQMLDKLVEGLGHLGIVTTTNKALGEVMILSTKHCWPELKKAIEHMPFEIEFF